MSKTLKDGLRSFGESTTIRGIPRAIKSTDTGLKLIWIIAIVLCVALLVYQLSLVALRYLRYESSTQFKESNEISVFPDITICNVYPLNMIDTDGYLSYKAKIQAVQTNWTCDQVQAILGQTFYDGECDDLWAEVQLPTGYFNNLPLLEDGSGDRNLIIDCSFYGWDWGPAGITCTESLNITWNSDYFRCYTIHVPSESRQDILGVTAVIYLNNFSPVIFSKSSANLGQSMATGVRVAIHSPGTVPDMRRGIMVGPGAETTVMLSATQRQRLPSPFESNCTKKELLDGSPSIVYTQEDCVEVCAQAQIIKKCSCISGSFSFTDKQMATVNYTICGNLTSSNGRGFSNGGVDELNALRDLRCSYNVDIDWEYCNDQCQVPCQEYLYDTTVSTSGAWPGVSYKVAFFEDYIADQKSIAPHFSACQEIIDNQNLTEIQKNQQIHDLGLIGQNFLQLNVLFERMSPYVMADKATMTVDNLFSQLGGTLSLWLGITIMTAIELVECFYMLCKQWRNAKKTVESSPSTDPVTVTSKM